MQLYYHFYLSFYVAFNTGSVMSRGNQYIQLVKVLCCKLPTIANQLPIFPGEPPTSVLPLRYGCPCNCIINIISCYLLFEFKYALTDYAASQHQNQHPAEERQLILGGKTSLTR